MRLVLLLFFSVAVAACGRSGLPSGTSSDMAGGGGSGGGSGGGGGTGGGGGSGGGGGTRDCAAACNRCPAGPCCGTACCGSGEWCDPTTNSCRCGDHAGCSSGMMCATGGPGPGPGGQVCGIICCGNGVPCPL